MFLKRYKLLVESEGHLVNIVDPGRLTNLQLLIQLLKASFTTYDLISLNYLSLKILPVLFILGLAHVTEVWDHNWPQLESWNGLQRGFYGFFLKRCCGLVLVGPHLKDFYRGNGIELPDNTRVQPAFLPPPLREEPEILASYPPEVHDFVTRSDPLIVANAFKLVFHEGVDLYGVDMCVRLVAKLRESFPRVGLLFAAADIGDLKYYAEIRRNVEALGLTDSFHFLTRQRELWPLFRKAHLMVRPSCRDGAAVSVSEAAFFGCPVVASDVAARPDGSILFANRDDEDFQRKCLEVINLHRLRSK